MPVKAWARLVYFFATRLLSREIHKVHQVLSYEAAQMSQKRLFCALKSKECMMLRIMEEKSNRETARFMFIEEMTSNGF